MLEDLLVLIPAYNESACIAAVLGELWETLPGCAALVVDDCSKDDTVAEAKAGAPVLRLPHHLGLGGAVQAGYKLAFELGYRYVIRIDGDGQHDPRDISLIYDTLCESGVEMVIGSRFLTDGGYRPTMLRGMVIRFADAEAWPARARPHFGVCRREPAGTGRLQSCFSTRTPRLKRWWCCSGGAFRFREVPCGCGRARREAARSPSSAQSIFWFTCCWGCL